MAKKHRKSKKEKQLRREIEILRAQLKTIQSTEKPAVAKKEIISPSSPHDFRSDNAPKIEIQIDDALVKKNLLKTMALSAVAFAVIIGLHIRG